MTILSPFTDIFNQNENIQETSVGELEAKPSLCSEILPPPKKQYGSGYCAWKAKLKL